MGEKRTTKRLCDSYDKSMFHRVKERILSSGIEPRINETARSILRERYFQKDSDKNPIEDEKGLYARGAAYVAMAEAAYVKSGEDAEKVVNMHADMFYEVMAKGEFMPNSPTLMNAGRDKAKGLLSACFVIPVNDDIYGIFSGVRDTAMIQQAGGGTGFDFSELRPTGDIIQSSGGTTSGPLSFLRVYSEATNAIQQGAFRRGANMGMMYVTHPNILSFIYSKSIDKAFSNFNLSVKITDQWMDEFLKDRNSPHITTNPHDGKQHLIPKSINVRSYSIDDLDLLNSEHKRTPYYTKGDLFDLLVHSAWLKGEPGIVFIDEMNRKNPTPGVGRIEATNPCGEQPLLPYESCNLGSIDVGKMTKVENGRTVIDWDKLDRTIRIGCRFLDDVIDCNNYPLEEIDAISFANRKIGLGLMGFADLLTQMRIPYNSEEAIQLGENLMKRFEDVSHEYSLQLGKERGPFPNIDKSIHAGTTMRNAATTTVAPTGTISIIANSSGGIEPLFALWMTHTDGSKNKRPRVNAYMETDLRGEGKSDDEIRRILEGLKKGEHLGDIPGIPKWMPNIYVTAHDIAPEWHVRMQAAFQRHCDASISKTINFDERATEVDIGDKFILSYKLKCKGITVYRNGCRPNQPLTIGDTRDKPGELEQEVEKQTVSVIPSVPKGGWHGKLFPADYVLEPIKVPEMMPAVKIKQKTPWGNMHVKVIVDPTTGRKYEVFAQLAKGGEAVNSDLEALCRVNSAYLRIGGDGAEISKQMRNIGSNVPSAPTREGTITSLADALGRALEKYDIALKLVGIENLLLGKYEDNLFEKIADMMKHGENPEFPESEQPKPALVAATTKTNGYEEICPVCKEGKMIPYEGCKLCNKCGNSQC